MHTLALVTCIDWKPNPAALFRRTVITFREDPTKDEIKFKFVSQYPVFTFVSDFTIYNINYSYLCIPITELWSDR